jgi:fumarate reductase flavoprotein subunit
MAEEIFDVIVVGGGGSGLAAAIEALAAGAQVVLLEKNEKLGGSTAWSIGSITSTGTPHQARHGIVDRPEDHFADMPLFAGELAGRDNDELRRILCNEVPDAFRWLMSLGVRFYGPMPEPPHKKPRMHNVLPNSLSYIYHLGRHARRAGVELRYGARAASLIVEGVNATATGDGQKLALALGARIVNGDLALGPEIRFIAPARTTLVRRLPPWRSLARAMEWAMEHMPPALLRPFIMGFLTTALAPSQSLFEHGARLVNGQGERFCDERDRPALALADQPGKFGYILVDGRLAQQFSAWPHFISTAPGIAYAYIPDYRRNRPDVYTEASSLAELARKLDMQPEALGAAMGQGEQAPMEPPFIALGPVRPVFVHNEGGLAVDTHHRVLDGRGEPIRGLYAAGSTGQGGLLLKGHGHHLAWAFVSGRRAGRFAALVQSRF